MKRMTLADLSPKAQAEYMQQWATVKHPRTVELHNADLPEVKKRIRQDSRGLNKTEAAFEAWLRCDNDMKGVTAAVFVQAVTLKLGNGVRYTPDFIALDICLPDRALRAYEVKGFMRDDAAVKLKVAASLYPWIAFHLVTKRKGGGWDMQEILA